MPVQQGPVLILNGDQAMSQVQDQMQEVDMPADAPVHVQTNWHLKRMHRFCELMEEIKPKLVIVDSLIGCSGGSAFDENKSEFAASVLAFELQRLRLPSDNGAGDPPRQQAGRLPWHLRHQRQRR